MILPLVIAVEASVMLSGPWVPQDTRNIDFDHLPRVPVQHVIVSDVRTTGGVNQHNYLTFHEGQFWLMWSDGPGVEDRGGQRVKFATSADGLKWSAPAFVTPAPHGIGPESPQYNKRTAQGWRYISRGFWQRDGELLALAALDEAAQFFGPGLQLDAFRWNQTSRTWVEAGTVCKDAINNFPPRQIPTGVWLMSRRPHDYKTSGVQFLLGGVKRIDDWQSFPVMGTSEVLKAEEPEWWMLPDGRVTAVFRDNGGSGFLHRSFSGDNGRSWSRPVQTNFPDATSKFCCLRLNDGRYAMVSNPRPKKRDPLALSLSDNGTEFNKMFYLFGGRKVDYPHLIEHDGELIVAFSGAKQTVEVVKVKLTDVNALTMPMFRQQVRD